MIRSTLAAAGLLACAVLPAYAETFSFDCISNNGTASCADGESALSVTVAAFGANQVEFTFTNHSALGSSIREIYFDDGTLLGIASLSDSGSGVTFSQIGSASPGNLPGGQSMNPAFVATQGFMVDTGNGGPSKGVENMLDGGVQEFVTIRFNLINNKTFGDTLAALHGPLGDGNDLRIGVHATSFAGGGSESFVTSVPESSLPMMGLAGLAVVGFIARSKQRRRHA